MQPVSVRPALVVYVASRLGLGALAAVVVLLLEERANPNRWRWDSERLHELGIAADVWARWDSDWYLRIAESWYDWPSSAPAFFPLYPLLVGGLGRVLGDHFLLAGILVSLTAGGAAFAGLFRLTAQLVDRETALRTVVYLALIPTSLYLGAVYSESLFLALAVATFLLAERGSLRLAAVVAGLALLTRSQGLALLPALLLFARREAGWRPQLEAVVVPLAVFAAYPLALWVSLGRPLAFVDAQEVWGRSFPPDTLPTLLTNGALDGRRVVEVLFALAFGALAVVAWRRLGPAYGVYSVVVLALPVLFASDRFGPLYSFPRLALPAFPCLVALALVTRTRPAFVATCVVLAAGLAVFVVRWSLWHWVA